MFFNNHKSSRGTCVHVYVDRVDFYLLTVSSDKLNGSYFESCAAICKIMWIRNIIQFSILITMWWILLCLFVFVCVCVSGVYIFGIWYMCMAMLLCVWSVCCTAQQGCLVGITVYIDAKQKHLGCKKGEANQKHQLSDYTCN